MITRRFVKALLIGPFPPPRNGVSAVNAYVANALKALCADVEYCDTSSGSVQRQLLVRLSRLPRIFATSRRLVFDNKLGPGAACYLSMSGGWGLWYEAVFIILARLRRMRVFVHHHSFSYIDRYSLLMQIVSWLGGGTTVHIVLCQRMKEVFGRRYGVQQIRIASNAACMELKQVDRLPAQKFSLRTVGYLSNLSFEKGLADVFAVARRMPGTQFHIAGPFQDKAVEGYFRDAAAGLQNIKYVGPVFGDAKRDFYAGLDAFVFPTKYKNEAEPLVILEALMYGCPVVANNRGCIGGLLADGVGALVMNADAFAIEASEVLQSWSADSTLYAQLSQAARLHFNGLFAQARKAQGSLLDEILAIKSNDVE